MKKLYLLAVTATVFFAASLVFASCNEDAVTVVYEDPTTDMGGGETDPEPEATLDFSQSTVTLNGRAQTAHVIAITNVKKVEATSTVGWCVASVSGKMIQLVVSSNDGETPVSATITVTASALDDPGNKITKSFTLVQSAQTAEIVFAQTEHTVYGKGGVLKMDYATNVSQVTAVTRAPDDTWCTAAIVGGKLEVTTTANPNPATRTAVIDVTAGSAPNTATAVITIHQQDPALDPTEWAIGDLVELSDTEKGILFWISDDKQTGQIISLDISPKIWATQSFGVTNATANETSNMGNSNAARVANHTAVHTAWNNAVDKGATFSVNFPAFAHCEEKGTGWYMPTVIDCTTFLTNIDKKAYDEPVFKAKMDAAGCTVVAATPQSGFTSYFYTNSESSDVQARCVDLRITNAAFKAVTSQNKHGSGRAVRCVKEVSLQTL